MTRILGKRYQEFLDNIEAYCYFPSDHRQGEQHGGRQRPGVGKAHGGTIDQAGGLAFAIRDWANYFVFRINALEDNAVLFEFRNGKRFEQQHIDNPCPSRSVASPAR